MSPEKAIKAQYGVTLGPSAGDGKYRLFRIDQLRNGYLIKMPGAAVFGSIIDDECFAWAGGEWEPVEKEIDSRNDNWAIRVEWVIWHIARGAIMRGEKLTQGDEERLKLAVKRLEAWL